MNTIHKTILIGTLLAGGVAVAVATDQPAGGESSISPNAKIDAEQLWRQDCAACHGRDGKGETRAGRRANAPDMTEAKFHESVSDERAIKSITKGIIDERGTERKKPFGDEFSQEEIKALVEYLRKFDPKHPRDLSEAALKATKKPE